MKLQKGQNISLNGPQIKVVMHGLATDHVVHILALNADGKSASTPIFYGNPAAAGIHLRDMIEGATRISLNLDAMSTEVERLVICLSARLGALISPGPNSLHVSDVNDAWSADIVSPGNYERSLLTAEIYRRAQGWRFRPVMNGYLRGIEALNEQYGIDLECCPPMTIQAPARR